MIFAVETIATEISISLIFYLTTKTNLETCRTYYINGIDVEMSVNSSQWDPQMWWDCAWRKI